MTFTEEENRIIEKMARAMCQAIEINPDAPRYQSKEPAWCMFESQSRRQYAAYRAMLEAINVLETPTKDHFGARINAIDILRAAIGEKP